MVGGSRRIMMWRLQVGPIELKARTPRLPNGCALGSASELPGGLVQVESCRRMFDTTSSSSSICID